MFPKPTLENEICNGVKINGGGKNGQKRGQNKQNWQKSTKIARNKHFSGRKNPLTGKRPLPHLFHSPKYFHSFLRPFCGVNQDIFSSCLT